MLLYRTKIDKRSMWYVCLVEDIASQHAVNNLVPVTYPIHNRERPSAGKCFHA